MAVQIMSLEQAVTLFMQGMSANELACQFEGARHMTEVFTRHALTHTTSASKIIDFPGATTQILCSSALNVRSDMFTNTLYTPRCFIELALIAFN
jgi:hypothetical protein